MDARTALETYELTLLFRNMQIEPPYERWNNFLPLLRNAVNEGTTIRLTQMKVVTKRIFEIDRLNDSAQELGLILELATYINSCHE